jgi:hypothetical protein
MPFNVSLAGGSDGRGYISRGQVMMRMVSGVVLARLLEKSGSLRDETPFNPA